MKKVIAMQLHEGTFISGAGELKRNITKKDYPSMIMELAPLGVKCLWKGVTFLIPVVNCKNIVLEAEEACKQP